ncbi:hypothetical protein TNCT_128321 [Trichonephila clavata]|uniref:Uncharacterized protein n=1 Tax=Trichonephila clavata TaxID=2740835 RepID=A0A8X6GH14_TRICU|nr:hypothetical protein TNCT_128321 [Trichonephila clavata]
MPRRKQQRPKHLENPEELASSLQNDIVIFPIIKIISEIYRTFCLPCFFQKIFKMTSKILKGKKREETSLA